MNREENIGHSHECRYKDVDRMLYAYLEICGEKCLLSANEMSVFEDYLEYGQNNDKDIHVDLKSNETSPYQLVYGGVMYREEITATELEAYLTENKGCALIDLDSAVDGHIVASEYVDMKLYKEHAKGNWMPFVALMKTHHVLHNTEGSITMFPYCGSKNCVWEQMINKPFLLACRETVAANDIDIQCWWRNIDKDLLIQTFAVADLYIPNGNEPQDKRKGV